MNRLQIKNQLIELFKNDDILQYELNITMLDARGREEEVSGVRVTKEAYSFHRVPWVELTKCHVLGTICVNLNGVLWPAF